MDIILQKLDQNGNYLNAIALGNSGDDQIIDMKIVNNEFYICGTFMDQVDFNPSILDHVMTSNGDKMHLSLNLEWPIVVTTPHHLSI